MMKKHIQYILLILSGLIIVAVAITMAVRQYNFNIEVSDRVELQSTYDSIAIARRWIAAHHYPIADNMFSCSTNTLEHRNTFWHACRATMPDGHTEEFSCNHNQCEPGNIISKLQ